MNEHRDEDDTCYTKRKNEIDPCPEGTYIYNDNPNWICLAKRKSAALIFVPLVANMIPLNQGHCYLSLKKE